MNIFCSYAFTGEDTATINKRMRLVVDTLNAHGHNAYCNLFDPVITRLYENDDTKGILEDAFQRVLESDCMVAIITSPNRSVGQLMEIGLALGQKKPVHLFEHTSAKGSTYLHRLVNTHLTWEDDNDLEKALQTI
jgi:hypothetical protein